MSAEASSNGVGASSSDTLSIAEQMQKKHAEAHNPTVEDVVDEEDVQHPPPSIAEAPLEQPPLSEKAMGKQKAEPQAKPKEQTLDTQSEELFPALGSGPKPRATGAVPSAWGAKKPISVANGVNGNGYNSSGPTSRVSTPASGKSTPAFTQSRVVNMPGRQTESVTFSSSQLKPQDKLKRPIPHILRDINKRSKATVESKPGPNGAIVFEGTGPSREHVQEALKEVARQIGAEVSGIFISHKNVSADLWTAHSQNPDPGKCACTHNWPTGCYYSRYQQEEWCQSSSSEGGGLFPAIG